MLTAFVEGNLVRGIIKAKRSLIIGYGIIVGIMIFNRHVAQGLVAAEGHLGALTVARALATAYKGLVHQVLGLVILAFLQQPLDLRQGLQGQGVAVVAGRAAPQGDVVQHNSLLLHPAVGHHAEMAVAQGEALLPDLCGGGVGEVPCRGIGLSLAAEDGEQGDDEREEAFHKIHSSKLFISIALPGTKPLERCSPYAT